MAGAHATVMTDIQATIAKQAATGFVRAVVECFLIAAPPETYQVLPSMGATRLVGASIYVKMKETLTLVCSALTREQAQLSHLLLCQLPRHLPQNHQGDL